ncbi:MAG: cupin domain-containing protein [Chloroflexi bacterium]|nr:cupin domain-containing protein [Chloroflexota bacterium]
MLQRSVYSKVRVAQPDPEALSESPLVPYPFHPESQFRIQTLFEEPACLVALEEWYKDNPTEWVFFNETLMVVQSGRAEMRWWNPPDWDDRGSIIVEPGMVFLCPRGARMWWTVLSDEPFRRLVVDIPNPGFGFSEVRSLV